MTIDFNRAHLASTDINASINALLDAAALKVQEEEKQRDYLGASAIGSECLRKVQMDWMCTSIFPARTKRIFQRGHVFEEMTARELSRAGFRMERGTPRCEFSQVNGHFRGHCDGIILDGPAVPGLRYPCLWEHKALGDSGWKKIERDGLRKVYPQYHLQVMLYQAYLELHDNPALFTVANANTCDLLHLLVEFDAAAAQAASDRAVLIIRATMAGELLDRISDNPDSWYCKMCQWRQRCWG